VQRQFRTAEVLRRIETKQLDPTARASHDPDDGFRALATYREFAQVVGLVTKSGADRQTARYRALYKRLEEEEQEREEGEPAGDSRWGYWLLAALQVGLPVAGVVALIWCIRWLSQMFQ
jgi:hypothetical protein